MTITEDLQDTYAQYQQDALALGARDVLGKMVNDVRGANAIIQDYSDNNKFNLIDTSIKQSLNDLWILSKAFIVDVEADADIVEVLTAPLTSSSSSSSSNSSSSSSESV